MLIVRLRGGCGHRRESGPRYYSIRLAESFPSPFFHSLCAEFEDVEFIANATVNLLLKEIRKDDGRRYPE
jgi:hypothetical protein